MTFVDESLLAKLVDKYGVDKEQVQATKQRLWVKIKNEYNAITGITCLFFNVLFFTPSTLVLLLQAMHTRKLG